MEAIALILVFSVLLNVLTLRWAFHEYAIRRQWQQEATALQHTLRSLSEGGEPHTGGSGLLLTALFFGMLVLGLAVLALVQ